MGSLTAEAVAYRARALAQAHPLSKLARQYLDWAVAGQRTSQPLPEIGIWAGSGLLEGYCVRRVEEEDLGMAGGSGSDQAATATTMKNGDSAVPGPSPTLEELDEAATRIAAQVRSDPSQVPEGAWGHPEPADEERLIEVLNRIVASQVSNRLSHWRDSIDDTAWAELEEYLAWWVVKGYALRVAEVELGAVRQ
jgi:hypothetical protein